jgi:hypothetical protein
VSPLADCGRAGSDDGDRPADHGALTSAYRRRLFWVLGGAALVVVAFAGWRVLEVAQDLRAAKDLIDDASQALTDGDLVEARRALGQAEELVLDANDGLRTSASLGVLRWLPGIEQNLRGIEESVALAATVVHGGGRIIDVAAPLQSDAGRLEVSLSGGSIPLEAVSAARAEIDALSVELAPALVKPRPSFLLRPVSDLRRDVYTEAASRSRQLRVLDRGLEVLTELAGATGPRRYLIAVANTAEMRGSGGMILNYGVLEGRDGTIDLAEFGRIDELALRAPVSSELVPADYLERWDGFEPLRRWRQANLAGDFTVTAPVLEAMYAAATAQPVNGVIQIDPHGLAAILEGVGPVTVPEVGEVSSENVVALTLNEAYFRFPNVEDRADVLGDVAEAAFQKLVDGEYPSLRPLAESLAAAVEGRHLLMHTTRSDAQAAVVAFGADGSYPAVDGTDSIALTVQNLAGNKLDYYLDSSLELTGSLPEGEPGALSATVTLTNTAPPGSTTPAYIFGPLPRSALGAGVVRSLVTLYLPLGASLEDASGDPLVEPAVGGAEAGRPFASFTVDVPAGERREVTLTLATAPPPRDARQVLVAVPSPRVRPTVLRMNIDVQGGPLRGDVELNRSWIIAPGERPVPLRAPLYR